MLPSATQQFRLEVASSQHSPSEIHPTSVEWDTSVPGPCPCWREVTRWSYKQPITLLLQWNERHAVDQRHYRRSVGGCANVKPIGLHVHNAHGTTGRIAAHRVWAINPTQRRWARRKRRNYGYSLARLTAPILVVTLGANRGCVPSGLTHFSAACAGLARSSTATPAKSAVFTNASL
jgi:hypothetical protein